MKKRVVLLHAENLYNYGAAMMVQNMIYYLGPDYEFYLDTGEENIGQIEDELPVDKKFEIKSLNLTKKPKIKNILDNVKNVYVKNIVHSKEILKVDPDVVIVLGGDDLSEYYAGWKIAIEFMKLRQLSKKTRVFLVGQTMGPFYSWRRPLAKHSLKDTTIFLRDLDSYNYLLEDLKWENNFHRASDLAFLPLPMQEERGEILDRYKLKKYSYITVVPSGLYMHYCTNRENYISEWLKILRSLAEEDRNRKIVLLAHVLKPDHVDDRKIVKELYEALKPEHKDQLHMVIDKIHPSEARCILNGGYFTITGRMHPAVSTYQTRNLALCLSYSVKYKGVIGKDLHREDLIIESKNDDLWMDGNMKDLVMEKVRYIIGKMNSLKSEVEKIMPEVEERAMLQIDKVKEVLDE